jgi:hypothetical protein
VLVQRGEDVLGGEPLRHARVAADVHEQHRHLALGFNVQDLAALDGQLQAKWAALRTALAQADVAAASALFTGRARDVYADQFSALAGAGALGQVAADLGGLSLVRVRDGGVEYELRAVQNGVEYSFQVLFILDEDGIWRLDSF